MTWSNRFRLYGGMLGVLLLVAVLVLVFNQRQAQAQSTNAQIVTDQYSVGAAYGGTVVKQDVKLGDSVTKGEPLFTVSSAQLATEVATGRRSRPPTRSTPTRPHRPSPTRPWPTGS